MANLAVLCIAWAFFLAFGGALGLNIPCILMIVGTVLHLIGK